MVGEFLNKKTWLMYFLSIYWTNTGKDKKNEGLDSFFQRFSQTQNSAQKLIQNS